MSRNRAILPFLLLLVCGVLFVACPEKEVAPPPPPPPAPEPVLQNVAFEEGLSADEIDAKHPLTEAGRAELTPENVEKLTQWQVNQLYERLDGGAIPSGPWQGRFFFAEGSGVTDIGEEIKGLPGEVLNKIVNVELGKLNKLGEALWKGKYFFKEEGVLRNMIEHEQILGEIFHVKPDEVRKTEVDGKEVALLFPAKLYCGESLMDTRRQSVIIDYAESDTIEGYIPNIDFLAAKQGLKIRDEVRFVRPGFYLGLAYFLEGKLLLTFTLYNEAEAKAGVTPTPECSAGGGDDAATTTEG